MAKFPVTEWQAEHVRLTIFPMPDVAIGSREWWQELAGGQPDKTIVNSKKGSTLIEGAFGPGKLALRIQPGRIDWMLIPPERELDELAAVPEFITFDPGLEIFETFSDLAEKWLSRTDLPAIARAAFGAVLVHPEDDHHTAYLRLPEYVPVKINPDSSDFLFQINPPRLPSTSGIETLRLNRLSKWSVPAVGAIAVRFPEPLLQTQSTRPRYALQVELDINTHPTLIGPIPSEKLVDVYRELVASGRSIATDGVVQP